MRDPRNLVILALVAAFAYLAGSTGVGNEALGQGAGATDANRRMIAVTGMVGSGVSVLYLVDTEAGQMAVYRCSGGKSIELVAARKIEWDFKIEEFHDESVYSPDDLRKRFRAGAEDGSGKGKED